jgi:cysteine-rich repeat protein
MAVRPFVITNRDTLDAEMLVRDWLKVLAPATALMLFTAGACDDELGAGECANPGDSQKCTCSDGRASTQTCDASGVWGACYCYVPGCGNGELDSEEECDDGNNESGDGCSDMCISEGSGNNGPGPGPGPGGGGTGASGGSPSTGGMGGSPSTGGMGGNPSTGGMGGNGGTSSAGGAGGAGGN